MLKSSFLYKLERSHRNQLKMGDYSQPQLEAMGLCPIRENLDQHIGYGKWDERRNFHTLVKAVTNQTDKPTSTVMWRCEAGNNILTSTSSSSRPSSQGATPMALTNLSPMNTTSVKRKLEFGLKSSSLLLKVRVKRIHI